MRSIKLNAFHCILKRQDSRGASDKTKLHFDMRKLVHNEGLRNSAKSELLVESPRLALRLDMHDDRGLAISRDPNIGERGVENARSEAFAMCRGHDAPDPQNARLFLLLVESQIRVDLPVGTRENEMERAVVDIIDVLIDAILFYKD